MDCLFKADTEKIDLPLSNLIPAKYVYFSHHMLSDIKNKKTYTEINPIVIIEKKKSHFLNLSYNAVIQNNIKFFIQQTGRKKYEIKTNIFRLKLKAEKEPLLEGGSGFLKFDSNSTYYYSLTDLKTKGKIKMNNKEIKVSGSSWMDHQWADIPYNSNKWNWFSMHLNNGTDIVCMEIYGRKKSYLVGIIDKENKTIHTKNVKIKNLKNIWISRKTGASYPLSWEIKIPQIKAILTVSPILKKQEMVHGIINYWEGAIKILGTINNNPILGSGFMELVGYPMKKSILKQYEEKIEKYFSENIKNFKKFLSKLF